MYGLHGERRLPEVELLWLPGYEGAGPVRIGNAASEQFQLDVYGEVMNVMHLAHSEGITVSPDEWKLQRALMTFLETAWTRPDNSIWEVRTYRRQFTHSKLMCWVAFDRALRTIERSGVVGPVERWRALRDAIFADIMAHGFDAELGSFTQSYDSRELDASLLWMPLVGFLPATDARMRGTVAAIERELMEDGFVRRYRSHREADGLPPGEGVFLPCSFWLVENYALQGRRDEAHALFERLCALANDVGLLSEEYDPTARRLVGNFPQAFSHVALINAARCLTARGGERIAGNA
jgi:GH15 family glucan-1,4-alpha-glucosidase